MGALRTRRDRAMALAMLLAGLRRCEVLGLRLCDINPGERRLFVVDGKGGVQRYVPVSPRFFAELGGYLTGERLGHKTLAMTLVYARIADRTVADEYFSVSEKVEALYDQPKTLPADAEGTEMAKLRREMHRRMLGNGYCARPVELDCHFESICESCTYFVTTVEFRPTIQAQRNDAEAKGQLGRVKVFDGLLSRLDTEAG